LKACPLTCVIGCPSVDERSGGVFDWLKICEKVIQDGSAALSNHNAVVFSHLLSPQDLSLSVFGLCLTH